jgi:predicted GNAT superfamily acetyltransferase
MKTRFQLRNATADDLESIWEINESNTPAVGSILPDQLSFLYKQSFQCFVVADHQVRAFCITFKPASPYTSPNYLWFSNRFKHFVYLDRIAVAKGFQNMGLGSLLYSEVEREMKTERFSSLLCCEVNVEPPNPGSLRFHLRAGFRELERVETKPGNVVAMLVRSLW